MDEILKPIEAPKNNPSAVTTILPNTGNPEYFKRTVEPFDDTNAFITTDKTKMKRQNLHQENQSAKTPDEPAMIPTDNKALKEAKGLEFNKGNTKIAAQIII